MVSNHIVKTESVNATKHFSKSLRKTIPTFSPHVWVGRRTQERKVMRLSEHDMARLSGILYRVVHSPYFDEDYDYAFESFEDEREARLSYQDYEDDLELLKEYRISIHE